MRNTAAMMILFGTALPACALQSSLAEELKSLGIPQARFTRAELNERVVGMGAKDGSAAYFVYLPASEQSEMDAALRLVRFDPDSGAVLRNNLKSEDIERCCGTAPLQIDFTRNLLLASFHLNPSANIVLVTDKRLQYKTTLYGFDFHEIAPDRIVYVEDQVHFAPAHPARVAFADLATGKTLELYPSKNDPVRAAFAKIHEQHMPAQADCQQTNDPCDPNYYDENIVFVQTQPNGFQMKVTRTAAHELVTKDAIADIPFQMATYTYRRTGSKWKYCAVEDSAAILIKSIDHSLPAGKSRPCKPSLPVLAEEPGTFSPHAQEKK